MISNTMHDVLFFVILITAHIRGKLLKKYFMIANVRKLLKIIKYAK